MNPQVKEVSKEDPNIICHYCHRSEVNSLEWGPLYQLAGVTVHYFCMLFSAGLSQNGEDNEGILGFLPIDIRKELKRGEKLKCKFCKMTRATIGCSVKNCKMSYHYPCGLNKKCIFHFIGNFESYCEQHKEVIKIPLPKEEWDCPICFCEVNNEDTPLWPPCCKKKVFHKRCIMEMAKNHGAHFFKCPLCNDRDIFSKAMRRSGVYLPDRDATWETVPNAFAEHSSLYSKCDAVTCLCPRGRDFYNKSESKPWKVVRCGACGASGIHKRCGNLQNLTWRCHTCADILSGQRRNESMNSSRIQRQQYDLSSDEELDDETPVVGIKDIISDLPEVENSSNADSSSEEDIKRVIYDDRYRRHLVVEDDDSDASRDSDDNSNEEIFIQSNTKLRQKLQSRINNVVSKESVRYVRNSKMTGLLRNALTEMNITKEPVLNPEKSDMLRGLKYSIDTSSTLHDDDYKWQNCRTSTFDVKLKNTIVKCCRQSSSTSTSGNSDGQFTNNVSNPVRTDSIRNIAPLSFPPVARDKLIKVDSKKKCKGRVILQPQPEVKSESPEYNVKISLKGGNFRECTINSSLTNSGDEETINIKEENDNLNKVASKTNANDMDVVKVENTKQVNSEETCITLDDDDESSDLEIVSEKVQPSKKETKSTAFLEMVKKARGSRHTPIVPIVRLGVDDDQNDDIEFAGRINQPKPTIDFSSFSKPARSLPSISAAFLQYCVPSSSSAHFSRSGSVNNKQSFSSVIRNHHAKFGPDRDVETVDIISDDEDHTSTAKQGESFAKKCSEKRERLSPTDHSSNEGGSANPSKRPRT